MRSIILENSRGFFHLPPYRRSPALSNREKLQSLRAGKEPYSVVAQGGLVLKRGQDLARVIAVIDKQAQASSKSEPDAILCLKQPGVH